MIAKNLLSDIGFSDEDIKDYQYYRSIVSGKIEEYAYNYMHSEDRLTDTLEKVSSLKTDKIHEYTVHLLFVLECTGYLEELYIKNNISLDIFVNSMKDIKCKLNECRMVHNIFGTFVASWYGGFFRMNRFAFGRLQFDLRKHEGESVTVSGHTLNEGDFYLGCHIPSSGPLLPELVEDSFRMAYDTYKDRLSGNTLFIKCGTYLFYPPFESVFGEESNTVRFAKRFELTQVKQVETFNDAWRIFGKDYRGITSGLKRETSLQKKFISYIDNGGTFGLGIGYALFNGKRIITKR